MIVPGSNILAAALSIIAPSKFQYLQFDNRTLNSIGLNVTNYKAPVNATGSIQPVARNLYTNMGLDFQKNYWNFYVPQNTIDVNRDVSGDQAIFQGQRFQFLSKTPWFGVDGWNAVLAVEVPTPSDNLFTFKDGDVFTFYNGTTFNYIMS